MTMQSENCDVVRITVDDDLTTRKGLKKAMDAVRSFPHKGNILVWVSIPCTGGSPWQRINVWRPGVRQRIEDHVALFRLLFAAATTVMKYVIDAGGYVAIEWPRSCAYWLEPEVQQFLWDSGLKSAFLDGCMFGLVSQFGASKGTPIRKPWRIDTNSPVVLQHLARPCDGSHAHAQCGGSNTKASESYTDELVACIHDAFAVQCMM